MYRQDEEIRPSKKMYYIGIIIMVVSVLFGITIIITGVIKGVKDENRFVVPGSYEMEVEVGKYTIYHEYIAYYEGENFYTLHADLSGLNMSVFDLDAKRYIPINQVSYNNTYSINSREGYAVLEFEVVENTRILIDGMYDKGDGEELVIMVQRGTFSSIVLGIFGGVGIILGGVFLGIIMMVIVSMKRSKAIQLMKTEEQKRKLEFEKNRMPEIWKAYTASAQIDIKTPYEMWFFGSDSKVATELLELVLEGVKKATTSLYKIYQFEKEELPEKGDYSIILDGRKRERCIIQTKVVRIIPFNEVDRSFAMKEGEGDQSLEYWRQVHMEAFQKELDEYRLTFAEDMLVVLEEFEVVWK